MNRKITLTIITVASFLIAFIICIWAIKSQINNKDEKSTTETINSVASTSEDNSSSTTSSEATTQSIEGTTPDNQSSDLTSTKMFGSESVGFINVSSTFEITEQSDSSLILDDSNGSGSRIQISIYGSDQTTKELAESYYNQLNSDIEHYDSPSMDEVTVGKYQAYAVNYYDKSLSLNISTYYIACEDHDSNIHEISIAYNYDNMSLIDSVKSYTPN